MRDSFKEESIYLIFLGKRGGGAQLLIDTSNSLNSAGIFHTVFCSSKVSSLRILSENKFANVIELNIPHSARDFISPKRLSLYFFGTLKLIYKSHKIRHSLIVQIMPSPFDSIVDFISRFTNSRIIRCIHDSEPHFGEQWPNRRAIASRVREADEIITFSNFSKKKIMGAKVPIKVLSLPRKFYSQGVPGMEFLNQLKGIDDTFRATVTFLGRGKQYQGLELLESLPLMFKDVKFVLAGEGNGVSAASTDFVKLNFWLTDAEFNYLLDK